MGVEIERKFLVKDDSWRENAHPIASPIRQGMLSHNPMVRVRTRGSFGFITVKGPKSEDGISCDEWEYEIPYSHVLQMFGLCDDFTEKTRYEVPFGEELWEIDVFEGTNQGLIIAEVELSRADLDIELPPWVGEEVTTDPRYLNSNLARHPFKDW